MTLSSIEFSGLWQKPDHQSTGAQVHTPAADETGDLFRRLRDRVNEALGFEIHSACAHCGQPLKR